MGEENREDAASGLVLRPIGDLLEGILTGGAASFPRYVSLYPVATLNNRISILLAGLALGPEAKDVVREQLSRRMSAEKWVFAVGLGEMGHPEIEGLFAQVLREKRSHPEMQAAVSCLGKIRGRKSLPLLIEALDNPYLFESVCGALATHGAREAVMPLLAKGSELAALRALASIGPPEGRELFVRSLGEGPPRSVEALRGIGRLGDGDLGHLLVPFFSSEDETEARAAFQAYAALGAPGGAEPLLRAAEGELTTEMTRALRGLDDDAVHRRLAAALVSQPKKGWIGRLRFWRRQEAGGDDREVYRALRGSRDTEVLRTLAARLPGVTDAVALRELLGNRALAQAEAHEDEIFRIWRSGEFLARYIAARALLQRPSGRFLSDALGFLGRPGFTGIDRTSPLRDEEQALSVWAKESNPCLLLGAFLDSGLVDMEQLRSTLERRVREWDLPEEAPLGQTLKGPEDREVCALLEALAEARPDIRGPLRRLWNLLVALDDRGDALLDLFVCSTGSHRGGIQRALFRALPAYLGQFLSGRDDRFLPELETLGQLVPATGPLRQPIQELFANARRTLMVECRDMTLLGEGQAKGDVVLIEELRGGR